MMVLLVRDDILLVVVVGVSGLQHSDRWRTGRCSRCRRSSSGRRWLVDGVSGGVVLVLRQLIELLLLGVRMMARADGTRSGVGLVVVVVVDGLRTRCGHRSDGRRSDVDARS